MSSASVFSKSVIYLSFGGIFDKTVCRAMHTSSMGTCIPRGKRPTYPARSLACLPNARPKSERLWLLQYVSERCHEKWSERLMQNVPATLCPALGRRVDTIPGDAYTPQCRRHDYLRFFSHDVFQSTSNCRKGLKLRDQKIRGQFKFDGYFVHMSLAQQRSRSRKNGHIQKHA